MTDTYKVPATLRRRLGLPLLVLYGTGITIGAGIYVLIGAVAAHAGIYAPWSFLMAALVMALTVGSYAELSTRFPVSAAEAAYVKAAFGSRALSTVTGLLRIVIGIASSATVTLGAAGYIQEFTTIPRPVIAICLVLFLGTVAAWGILEFVVLASLFTLVEIGGLLIVIFAGLYAGVPISTALLSPPTDLAALSGVTFASLLAFFAFIGFEDLANAVEEAKSPHRDIPRAMAATLIISTVLYVMVIIIAVGAVPITQLAASQGTAKPRFSHRLWGQPHHDQCHCHRRCAQYHPRTNDYDVARDLWHGEAERSAEFHGPRPCKNAHAGNRYRADNFHRYRASARFPDRETDGKHLYRDIGCFRLGERFSAATALSEDTH